MKSKYIIILSFAVLLPLFVQAQEQVVGLHGNPVIEKLLQSRQSSDISVKSQKTMTAESLWLPFFDDFTYYENYPPDYMCYPDSLRWSDNFAFVNSSFQKNPTNRGVATLDALNAEGKLYAHASPYPFMADYLTSRPIRTDSIKLNETFRLLTPDDSLYLSFYYQPQGLGDAPERHDSLILEFFTEYEQIEITLDSIYHPADTIWFSEDDYEAMEAYYEYKMDTLVIPEQWKHIWAVQGMAIDSFYAKHGQWMAQVMIPITDMEHFRPDFRFRFRNYASLPNNTLPSWQSNVDQWNIDYVKLSHTRTYSDTTYQDISFVNPGESLLENFTAMPYRQYAADPHNSMKNQFTTTFVNLDNVSQNASYKYRIYDPNDNLVGEEGDYYSIEWAKPIPPAITMGIQSAEMSSVMAFSSMKGIFSIKQTLIGDTTADPHLCDSITFVQHLENYFAYDDGTPEAGYGLTPAQAMLAVRFPLNIPDTLQAVDIYFNTTPARQSEGYTEYFKLMVWYNNHEEPGDTIYTSQEILYGSEAGKFIRFPIKRNVLVSSGFFVGIQQSTADNINIGFDYSNDMHSRNMYKIYNDPWKTSFYEGSIMIRPVMGTPVYVAPPPPEATVPKSITVFPNPLTSERQIYIQKPDSFDETHTIMLKIYNGVGTLCYESPYTKPEITLNNLYNGVFIIKLYDHTTGETATTKLMITR
jgi:hypothetical protein